MKPSRSASGELRKWRVPGQRLGSAVSGMFGVLIVGSVPGAMFELPPSHKPAALDETAQAGHGADAMERHGDAGGGRVELLTGSGSTPLQLSQGRRVICLVCRRNDTHRYACGDCTDTTRRRMRELEFYAEWLATPTMLARLRHDQPTLARLRGSRPPARYDVIIMLDARSTAEDIGGVDDEDAPLWSLLGTLHGFAEFVRGRAGQSSPSRVALSVESRRVNVSSYCAAFFFSDQDGYGHVRFFGIRSRRYHPFRLSGRNWKFFGG